MIASANGTIHTARSVDYDWRDEGLSSYVKRQQSASYGRYAYDDYSEDDSDRDVESSSVASSKVRSNDGSFIEFEVVLGCLVCFVDGWVSDIG